ncbi:transcriptional regulator [Paenibacillus sp. IB182496]|uniref:Transcriptional regulator n=1 Tax=Paenibacillus sabuli TaxID=2772509 RepID=A0A927BUA5_9BACL|nr:metalloregulator ArsR/SmtB family transcription factor [Paenibacillus sabuli]MBD2846006.1 transcriptional regulator [Paenibacillus sabuli]
MHPHDDGSRSAVRTQQLGSTRQTILGLLKTSGPQTANQLAAALGMTEMGVRRHLNALAKEQCVEVELVRQGPGRPMHRYRLTEAAQALFPKNYSVLALDLLGELEEQTASTELIEALFRGRKRKLLERYAPHMEGKSLRQRVDALAAIQNAGGYMVSVSEEKDELVLDEHNCPIAQVAGRYQQACACELELFEALLDAPLERTECLSKGGDKCRYRIRVKSSPI